jgi:hypothetical protein
MASQQFGQSIQPAGASERVRWLVLTYKLPAQPARNRAAVWRRLRTLGAVYLRSALSLCQNPGV